MSLTQDKTQSRHLGYYPLKIRLREKGVLRLSTHSSSVSLLKISMCQYMEEDTLYIGRSDLEGKMSEGRKEWGKRDT